MSEKSISTLDKLTFYLSFVGLIILGAIISNWFLDYSDDVNDMIHTVMFCFLGVYFILFGLQFENKYVKGLFVIAAVYLIAMNFFEGGEMKSSIGIVLLVTLMIIQRFKPSFTKS